MTDSIAVRLRKNREGKTVVGKFTFHWHRPTTVQAMALAGSDIGQAMPQIAIEYVFNWDGVIEDDVIGGGGSDPLPFTSEVWREWCADRSDFWRPIANDILAAYERYNEQLASAEKN